MLGLEEKGTKSEKIAISVRAERAGIVSRDWMVRWPIVRSHLWRNRGREVSQRKQTLISQVIEVGGKGEAGLGLTLPPTVWRLKDRLGCGSSFS